MGLDLAGRGGAVDAVANEVIERVVDQLLGEAIEGLATEVACDIGFEEDAVDVWEFCRR